MVSSTMCSSRCLLPTLSQAPDAVIEAIDVMSGGQRGWRPSQSSGRHARPEPAHEVEISFGASSNQRSDSRGRGPMVGPGLSFLKSDDLYRGNAVIDDAARASGPRESRGLLNLGGTSSRPATRAHGTRRRGGGRRPLGSVANSPPALIVPEPLTNASVDSQSDAEAQGAP